MDQVYNMNGRLVVRYLVARGVFFGVLAPVELWLVSGRGAEIMTRLAVEKSMSVLDTN